MIAPLFAVSIAAADAGAALRVEARERTAEPAEPASSIQELQLDASLRGALLEPTLRLFGAYEPRLRANQHGGLVEAWHQASAGVLWNASATSALRLDQRCAYGETDFSLLLAPGAPPDRLPQARTATLLRTSTSASLESAISARLRWTALAAFEVSGGADRASRESVPLQRGPSASLRAEWDASAADALSAALAASFTRLSSGLSADVATIEGSWSRRDAARSVGLGAGAGVSSDGARAQILPVASARARADLAPRLAADAAARVAPIADWLGAGVYERAELGGSLTYGATRALSLGLRGGGSLALTRVAGRRGGVAQSQADASLLLDRGVTASAGLRCAWVSDLEPRWRWLGFVSIAAAFGGLP